MTDVGRINIWFDDLLSLMNYDRDEDLTEEDLKGYLKTFGYPERYRNHICRGCKGCS